MAIPMFNNAPCVATAETAYSFTWDIIAESPVTTDIITGTLPPGLTLSDNIDNNNPVISGTPTTEGVYDFIISILGHSINQDVTMIIKENLPYFRYV